tara:strand:- start:57 stop:329 length:273 start_codon:yes stop_codon:yes gene_type:complete
MNSPTIKTGMKRIRKNTKSGLGTTIKKIKTAFVECIRFGNKRRWIPGVPSGGNTTTGEESGIPTSIRNSIKSIGNAFLPKRNCTTERRWV